MPEPLLSEQLLEGLNMASRYAWAYLPVVFGVACYQLWMLYLRRRFILGLTWVTLEVIPPPDVMKSPKLAESIFAGLHGVYKGNLPWRKMLLFGEVPSWFSFETVSHGGETHFLIRTLEGLRNVVESNIFAQYPDAEIRIVDDYIGLLPENVAADPEYDMFCTELIFTKENAFPIKTWQEFEEAGGKDEHARIDPIAPLLETMSALRPGEYIWVQYLMRPTGGDWVKEGQAVVDKLVGKEPKVKNDPLTAVLGFFDGLVRQALGVEPEEKKEEKKEFSLQRLTPAQKVVLENVEYKLAKLAFKSGIRILYAGRKDVFMLSRVSGITGMYKQLYFNNMNSFKPNPEASSKDKGVLPWMFKSDKGFFADARSGRKKKKLWKAYRERAFVKKPVVLNVEELATLWHLPGINVQAPLMPRVLAKKGQPPSFLPTK